VSSSLASCSDQGYIRIAYCSDRMSPDMEMQCLKMDGRKNLACSMVYLWNHLIVLKLKT